MRNVAFIPARSDTPQAAIGAMVRHVAEAQRGQTGRVALATAGRWLGLEERRARALAHGEARRVRPDELERVPLRYLRWLSAEAERLSSEFQAARAAAVALAKREIA